MFCFSFRVTLIFSLINTLVYDDISEKVKMLKMKNEKNYMDFLFILK